MFRTATRNLNDVIAELDAFLNDRHATVASLADACGPRIAPVTQPPTGSPERRESTAVSPGKHVRTEGTRPAVMAGRNLNPGN